MLPIKLLRMTFLRNTVLIRSLAAHKIADGMFSGVPGGVFRMGRTIEHGHCINGNFQYFACVYNGINCILLSACGYDPNARRERDKKKKGDPVPTKDSERRVPFDFTACLAHVEITELQSNGHISRIAGYVVHNEGCKSSFLKRLPAVPLHDHVYEVALDQLEKGAR